MRNNTNFFKNRDLLIVTKHKKEQVIAPLFQNNLGVKFVLSKQFDTDTLGTFSGEIERQQNALETLKLKCLLAMEQEGYDLAIATEGSFGNHPTVFFAPANDELILLYDKKNNFFIFERHLSLETNFNTQKVTSRAELDSFLEAVNFPSHAVIVKDKDKNWSTIIKGIHDIQIIKKFFEETKGSFFIETDMRALHNPTRMRIIEEVSNKLLDKINSICPNCHIPGFGVVSAEAGLLCDSCSMPTKSILAHIYQCQNCNYELKKMHPNNKETEDPMYCDFCNP